MNLAQFFKLVTGLKTACTHAGIDAKTATLVVHENDGSLSWIEVRGEGAHGPVSLHFEIDD